MQKFSETIQIIGVNPYVEVPEDVLKALKTEAKKETSPIPVKGTLQGKPYIQTVVKFRGLWRLYINTPMIKSSATQVGDTVTVEIEFDSQPRTFPVPKLFQEALIANPKAKTAFEKLPPYRRKEIVRYLGFLKNEETLRKNIDRTIQFLEGQKIKGALFY